MVQGIPVVVATNGRGFPVRPVTANAPVMTIATNGIGAPIVISDRGAPFIVQGLEAPEPDNFSILSTDDGELLIDDNDEYYLEATPE